MCSLDRVSFFVAGRERVEELPPLVYQLLLLCNKGEKQLVLRGLVEHLGSLEPRAAEDEDLVDALEEESEVMSVAVTNDDAVLTADRLRPVQGTCILHITFAAKQDQELGREFTKYLKSGPRLTTFSLALALALSRVHRYEAAIFEQIKSLVNKAFREEERGATSPWINELPSVSIDVQALFLETISHSVFGWDQVVHGLLLMGLALMDGSKPDGAHRLANPSPAHRALELGAKILQKTFVNHSDVREEMLEQILNRVLAKSSASALPHVALLARIVQVAPVQLTSSEHAHKLRDALDYISHIELTTATRLMAAVQPVVGMSASLRDSLMLVLRKALFSRDQQARTVAVTGFIMVLVDVTGRTTNASSSQQSSQETRSSETLALEIIGTLRRCLTQQGEVREHLYKEFSMVAANRSCAGVLRGAVLDVLLPQLAQVRGSGLTDDATIDLNKCVRTDGTGKAILIEPLHHLLACIGATIFGPSRRRIKAQPKDSRGAAAGAVDDDGASDRSDNEDDGDDAAAEDAAVFRTARTELEQLARACAKADLGDFGIEKEDEYTLENPDGPTNVLKATLLLGSFETLLGFLFMASDRGVDACTGIIKLFKKHADLAALVCKNEKKEKKGGGGMLTKALTCLGLELSTAAELFKAVHRVGDAEGTIGLQLLRNNEGFVRFTASAAHCSLQRLLANGRFPEEAFEPCTTIAVSVVVARNNADAPSTVSQTSGGGGGSKKKGEKGTKSSGKSVDGICTDALLLAVTAVCQGFPGRLSHFLTAVGDDALCGDGSAAAGLDGQMRFYTWLSNQLISTLDGEQFKDCTVLVAIITTILSCTCKGGVDAEGAALLRGSVDQLCLDHRGLQDSSLGKALISLLLEDEAHGTETLVHLTQDCLSHLGCIQDDDDAADDSVFHFKLVSSKLCETGMVPLLIIASIERFVSEIEWVLPRLANIGAKVARKEANGREDLCDLASHITERLIGVVEAATLFAETQVDNKICTDFLRSATRIFTVLSSLLKFRLSAVAQKNIENSEEFRSLVDKNAAFTEKIYNLVSFITGKDSQPEDDGKSKAVKRKRAQSAATRESRNIPNLIYAIEQYDRFVIQIASKGGIRLKVMKRSAVRDFKIDLQKVEDAIARGDESDEEEESQTTKKKKKQKKASQKKKASQQQSGVGGGGKKSMPQSAKKVQAAKMANANSKNRGAEDSDDDEVEVDQDDSEAPDFGGDETEDGASSNAEYEEMLDDDEEEARKSEDEDEETED
jgi:Fanconi anemia group I protein